MRVWRAVLIVAVVLGGLFVAADRIAVSVAQNKAAERAQATEGLDHKPKVSIEGFPFLTQAAFGKLDDVKISADDIAARDGGQSLRIATFDAHLHGVKFSNGYRTAIADSADGVAFITYADLSKAAPLGITVSSAGTSADGKAMVRLTGTIPGIGAKLSVLSQVTVRGADSIGLHAVSLPKELTALGLEDNVRQQIDFVRQLTHLPSGISLTSLTTSPVGISVAAGGKHVTLAG
ncbi:LmeA family phospholipid-binding protein [Actinacidiphila paucisporea]|uniref:DUF2993 domain-containing protein n=1 Tax=Actinacidiphila paucisporea TaxID=310782 RepID=A0A1M7PAU5_9ACTN|nr:DUF2993 domain-containing protein [Actinacidiphila paucisporea]SHN13925.1 Protein of unknown function [Actinacidiphila paucisporea]